MLDLNVEIERVHVAPRRRVRALKHVLPRDAQRRLVVGRAVARSVGGMRVRKRPTANSRSTSANRDL